MTGRIYGIFKNKRVSPAKLEAFGFVRGESGYVYERILEESGFRLTVCVTGQGEVLTEMLDPALNEPYTLHLVEDAAGSFVGGIKVQYEEVLREIADRCFEPDVFKCGQARELIAYVRDVYRDEPEFLWKKFDGNAVWRRKDTGKWYGVLLTVSKRKLGIDSDDMAEVLDFHIQPEELERIADGRRYFPGYHMNKKHWCSIILDGSVAFEEVCRRIDDSYAMAAR